MITSVSKLKTKWGYGFDEEYHDWNDLLEKYPNCTIWCVQVSRDIPFQYPPNGAKVYKWIKREFEGEVFPEDDMEKLQHMVGDEVPTTEKIHTDQKTEEERYAWVKDYRRYVL